MIYILRTACLVAALLMIPPNLSAQQQSEKETVRIARATWDTGWFQTEVFRQLLQEMGYSVTPAETMTAEAFYKSAANGKTDVWVNGWFPLHEPLLRQYNDQNSLETVGYEVEKGALQGYLIDRRSSESLGIESLEQLRDPQLAEHFDSDGDGRADLIGCNADWSCHTRINEHIEALNLGETVKQVYGDYNPMARNAIESMREGRPLLLYTWTPNWTLGEVEQGEEVQWLHVPVSGQQQINKLEGAARNPVNLGYDLNDIRVVANNDFLQSHPDIRSLFEQLSIPLEDIQRQNARMAGGEGSQEEIRDHARQWIKDHETELRQILLEAGVANPFGGRISPGSSPVSDSGVDPATGSEQTIRVVTQEVEPLVMYRDREYSGFSIEVFDAIAEELNMDYSIYSVNSIAKMLDDVKRGEADIATAALGITSAREEMLEFSHPYYDTGLQIMIPQKESTLSTIPRAILSIIFSKELLVIFLFFFGVLIVSAHIIWVTERNSNDDFPESYWKGMGVSIWWAAVTVTTVGYGDKTPKGLPGRVFGLFWIFAGYFAFSYFTATVTSTVTLQEIESNIRNMEDLYGHEVATVRNSAAEFYLVENGINPVSFNTVDEAANTLLEEEVDAVVYDAPVLQHFASQEAYGKASVTGSLFEQQSYGFALPRESELRKDINLGYLKILENGVYEQIQNRWFGN